MRGSSLTASIRRVLESLLLSPLPLPPPAAQSGQLFPRCPGPQDTQSPPALGKGGSQIRRRVATYARLPKHLFGERPTLKGKMLQSVMLVASNGKRTHRKQPKLRPRESLVNLCPQMEQARARAQARLYQRPSNRQPGSRRCKAANTLVARRLMI